MYQNHEFYKLGLVSRYTNRRSTNKMPILRSIGNILSIRWFHTQTLNVKLSLLIYIQEWSQWWSMGSGSKLIPSCGYTHTRALVTRQSTHIHTASPCTTITYYYIHLHKISLIFYIVVSMQFIWSPYWLLPSYTDLRRKTTNTKAKHIYQAIISTYVPARLRTGSWMWWWGYKS